MNSPGVWPCLTYADADAARRFLTEVFGFAEALTVRGEDGTAIVHAELTWPEGGGLMYGSAGTPSGGVPEPPAGGQWLYVVTADPDAVHERAVAAGATVVHAPYDTDYGSRNVGLADPEGNVWTFGTYRGA
ncbi:glyoxalase [Amycolatopsis antarctica]|uniref:Glyoxalase n=1 Tax=Amycolatopsis antarctica TaxID=1854586 RepID=A0A263CYP7_9PSEU|nr:VOC family protein [Amycolatopsis antarctica]OZM70225.1 glyoxalase [Amycolatopsis antarctica]